MSTATEPEAPSAFDNLVQEANDNFKQLVIKCAQGHDPKPKEVRDVLNLAGVSMDEFKTRVEDLKARLALVADLKRANEMQGEIATLNDQSRNLVDELTAAEKEYFERVKPMQEKYKRICDDAFQLTNEQATLRVRGNENLLKTADPRLLAENAQLSSKLSELRFLCKKDAERSLIRNLPHANEKQLAAEKERAAKNHRDSTGRREELARKDARLAELRRMIMDPIGGFDFGVAH